MKWLRGGRGKEFIVHIVVKCGNMSYDCHGVEKLLDKDYRVSLFHTGVVTQSYSHATEAWSLIYKKLEDWGVHLASNPNTGFSISWTFNNDWAIRDCSVYEIIGDLVRAFPAVNWAMSNFSFVLADPQCRNFMVSISVRDDTADEGLDFSDLDLTEWEEEEKQ